MIDKLNLLVDSVYINTTGGKVLLEYFIKKLVDNKKFNFKLIIDVRLKSEYINLIQKKKIFICRNSESERRKIYKKILKSDNFDSIFCLSNIPPPTRLSNKINVVVYFHNLLFLENSSKSFFEKIKFYLKFSYIKFIDQKYNWIVQTKHMKTLLLKKTKIKEDNVHVLPFFNSDQNNFNLNEPRQGYIYVSNGNSHKNHLMLLKVWEKLFEMGFNLNLTLTVDDYIFLDIKKEIYRLTKKGLKIKNLGLILKNEIEKEYLKHKYLIFPSLHESFGLPLVEGVMYGCKILCSDLPYARELIKTNGFFNPRSVNSLVNLISKIEKKEKIIENPQMITENNIEKIFKIL